MARTRNTVPSESESEGDTTQPGPLQINNSSVRSPPRKRVRKELADQVDKQDDDAEERPDGGNPTASEASDDDEVVVVAVAPKSKKAKRNVTAELRALGRHIGRSISLTADIEEAVLQTPVPDLEPYQVQANKKVADLLKKLHPRQYSLIATEGPQLVVTPLNEGRRDAHNQDVRDLKGNICKIYGLEDAPDAKIDWGFRWTQSARLLRPMDVEEGSEEWDSICAGNEFPDADEFPALMWDGEDGPVDPERPSDGFLTSPRLLKVARVVLFPPRYVHKTTPASTGYAQDWGIKKVSSNFIAYVVELTRFTLSSEANYAKTDFDYAGFYENIVRHLNDPPFQDQTRQIHEVWNERLFGQAPVVTRNKGRRVGRRANGKPSTARFIAELGADKGKPARKLWTRHARSCSECCSRGIVLLQLVIA